jgi:SAM-dependent methyltransferase
MGNGRHALLMAERGLRVFGVDRRFDAVRGAARAARNAGLQLNAWCADLTVFPLPQRAFDVILVTRYLQRDLFPSLAAALAPDGVIVYETFTEAQLALATGPRSPEHLLAPGELRRAFAALDLVFYEEATRPEAVARLVARRFNSSYAG